MQATTQIYPIIFEPIVICTYALIFMQCYCFVCDCPASACTRWAAGAAAQHHCHAHRGDKKYQDTRRTHKQQRKQNMGANMWAFAHAAAATAWE